MFLKFPNYGKKKTELNQTGDDMQKWNQRVENLEELNQTETL